MNVKAITIARPTLLQDLARRAVLGVQSASSRRNYMREIGAYLNTTRTLNRESVQAYIRAKQDSGASPSGCNITLCAIKTLVREAIVHNAIDQDTGFAILSIPLVRRTGQRMGNWIDATQLRDMIAAVQGTTTGTRDAAILACIYGCGLRRAEVASLTWDNWRMIGGRWAWVDIVGKRSHVRTVPCSTWAATLIERWRTESGADRD